MRGLIVLLIVAIPPLAILFAWLGAGRQQDDKSAKGYLWPSPEVESPARKRLRAVIYWIAGIFLVLLLTTGLGILIQAVWKLFTN